MSQQHTRDGFKAFFDAAERVWKDSGSTRLVMTEDEVDELGHAMQEMNVHGKIQRAAKVQLLAGVDPEIVVYGIYCTMFEFGALYERRRREEDELMKGLGL